MPLFDVRYPWGHLKHAGPRGCPWVLKCAGNEGYAIFIKKMHVCLIITYVSEAFSRMNFSCSLS